MRNAPTHPLANRGGLVAEARAVLFDAIGWGPHPCHWCGRSVNWKVKARSGYEGHDELVADHLDSNFRDDRVENLVPACGPCNGTRARRVGDEENFITRSNGTRLRVKRAPCAKCEREFNATHGRVCSTCRLRQSRTSP